MVLEQLPKAGAAPSVQTITDVAQPTPQPVNVLGLSPIVLETTNTVLTSIQSGVTMVQNSSSIAATNYLPSAIIPGMIFKGYVITQHPFAFQAAAADTITMDGAQTGLAGHIANTNGTQGASIVLVCTQTNQWSVFETRGANWSF